jgi:hypothetical protein
MHVIHTLTSLTSDVSLGVQAADYSARLQPLTFPLHPCSSTREEQGGGQGEWGIRPSLSLLFPLFRPYSVTGTNGT